VKTALAHALFDRARAAFRRGECRRETPITQRTDDGALIEGVVDLAFREDGTWTVIEFKTDREIQRALAVYEQQVRVYASAIAMATGEPTRAVLLRV
jgi:ATP-dependent exoDNAse (exonuclease V) beta subunit